MNTVNELAAAGPQTAAYPYALPRDHMSTADSRRTSSAVWPRRFAGRVPWTSRLRRR